MGVLQEDVLEEDVLQEDVLQEDEDLVQNLGDVLPMCPPILRKKLS